MTLRYIGGPFDGHEATSQGSVSIRPISEVHIGIAGGGTNIESVEAADRIASKPIGSWAVYVLEVRNGMRGFYHLMNITPEEFESLASGTHQRLRELAQSRGLLYPF